MTWKLIETVPDEIKAAGTPIVCWKDEWEPCFLMWKTNPRIVRWNVNKKGEPLSDGLSESYFGDLNEMDDYELAKPGGGPTHWHPLDQVPEDE